MTKVIKWLVGLALALLALFAAAAFALHLWVGTDDFRQRMAREATKALGVPVTLGAVVVAVWPLPALALKDIEVQSKPPLTLGRVDVRPEWQALLQGRLVVTTLIVRQAVLPQQGIDALLLARQKKETPASSAPASTPAATQAPAPAASQARAPQVPAGAPSDPASIAWLPRRMLLDGVTWTSAAGASTTLDAEARLGTDGLPDSASLSLTRGNLQGLRATLARKEPAAAANAQAGQQWALRIDVGGGKVDGQLGMQQPSASTGHTLVLQGQLQTHDVEVSALTAPNRPLSGLLEASTTFSARAATTNALVEALQSHTTFTVRNATLNGIDLVKAVKSVGLSRGGETKLQTLSGRVSTQGRATQLSELVASSGVLRARGEVAVSAAKALSGRINVDLSGDSKLASALGGAVGVPLVVGGTLAAPEVTLSRSALLGAALGTVVLPGVGTGAGAKLGDKVSEGLKKLFGK